MGRIETVFSVIFVGLAIYIAVENFSLTKREQIYKEAIHNACHACELTKIPGYENVEYGWKNVDGKCVQNVDIRATFACTACAGDGKTFLDRH